MLIRFADIWHIRIKGNRLEVTSKLRFAQHTCYMALRHLRRRAINSLTTTYISTTTISSSSIASAHYNVRLADDERKLFFSEQNHSSSIVHNSFARWQATLVLVLSGGSRGDMPPPLAAWQLKFQFIKRQL